MDITEAVGQMVREFSEKVTRVFEEIEDKTYPAPSCEVTRRTMELKLEFGRLEIEMEHIGQEIRANIERLEKLKKRRDEISKELSGCNNG